MGFNEYKSPVRLMPRGVESLSAITSYHTVSDFLEGMRLYRAFDIPIVSFTRLNNASSQR